MQKAQEHEKKYSEVPRVFNKYSLSLVVIVFIYLCFVNLQSYIQDKDISRQEQQLRVLLIKEKALNSELRKKLVNAKEPLTIEVLAREKLGMIKKGETAYMIAN